MTDRCVLDLFSPVPGAVTAAVMGLMLSVPASGVTLRAAPERPPVVSPGVAVLATDPVGSARSVWAAWAEDAELDPRTDLIELDFAPGMREGSVKVTGVSASPQLLAGLYAALSTQGIPFESAVRQLPDVEALRLLTRGVVRSTRAPAARTRQELLSGRSARRVPLAGIVEVLENTFDGVVRVRLDDGWIGWMRGSDLSLVKEAWLVAWNRREKILVTDPRLRLKTPAGAVVAEVRAGVKLPVLGRTEKGEWLAALPDGREVVVPAGSAEDWERLAVREENARRTDPAAFRAAVARTAGALAAAGWSQREDGTPVVTTAFRLHDLILDEAPDRAARLSAPLSGGRAGGELLPGDLVFFGCNGTPERTGIWLGEGRFVAEVPGTDGTERAAVLKFTGGRTAKDNGGAGPFLHAERLSVEALDNPCLLSTRASPFHQAPPGGLSRCRLR